MSYWDEYNSWHCDHPEIEHPNLDCEAVWQHCDSCWDDKRGDYPEENYHCDDCGGVGGGYVCIHSLKEGSGLIRIAKTYSRNKCRILNS